MEVTKIGGSTSSSSINVETKEQRTWEEQGACCLTFDETVELYNASDWDA